MDFFPSNMEYLRKTTKLRQSEIQDRIGIERTTWSNYERGKSFPNLETFYKIVKYFGVNADDVLNVDLSNVHLNENGGIKKNNKNVQPIVQPIVHPFDKKQPVYGEIPPPMIVNIVAEPGADYGLNKPIPITDINVAAGMGAYNQDYVEKVDYFGVPNHLLAKKNGNYLTVRIKGPSMAPTLQDGGYMVIRMLDKAEWAKMRDERIFVVVDREGHAYLKRVKNRFNKGFIVLMSDNPDKASFGNFNLQIDDINSIWDAEFYISAKMPNIHDSYYSRLQLLEDVVADLAKKIK